MVVINEHRPDECSSFSSSHHPTYDVFLSFRGADTRFVFLDHLCKSLIRANISNTFRNDEKFRMGEDIKPEMESAIKASKASIIVLSEYYATSSWCLDELVLTLEQRKRSSHCVYPIFYQVEPIDVRMQQGSFGDAMEWHKRKMKAETNTERRRELAQKIERWQYALKEVADLKGSVAPIGRPHVGVIEGCIKDIYRILRISSRFPLPQLFGMDDSIKFVTSWLKDESSDTADILTILGMGGIGKTSLAKYVYALHAYEFDTSTFIEDISRRCFKNNNGLLDVQKELSNEISKPSSVQVRYVSVYTSRIENALAYEKVFLVLDDVDTVNQLDALLGSKGIHPGSKIIISTRKACLTQRCSLFKTYFKPKHLTYKLQGLSEMEENVFIKEEN